MYQFKCSCAEIHGNYHVQSLVLWQGPDDVEWVAGDSFEVRSDAVDASGEHDAILMLISTAVSRISRKMDRELF